MPPQEVRLLFADSNVFVEDLFVEDSAASVVMDMVAAGSYRLCTCQTVISDVERAILKKLGKEPEQLDQFVSDWHQLKHEVNLQVVPDAVPELVRQTYYSYIALMRHKNDIPILACALTVKPYVVLSGNREHFNDKVAAKSGIPMLSCEEFLQRVAVI
jgi:predicted nucleic acid-binding protein